MWNQSFCVLYLENIKYCAAVSSFGLPVCHLTDFFLCNRIFSDFPSAEECGLRRAVWKHQLCD